MYTHWRTNAHELNECFIEMDVCHWKKYMTKSTLDSYRMCMYSHSKHVHKLRSKERQTITHSYKRAPVHNHRITLNAFNIYIYFFILILLLFFFLFCCLLERCFDGLCLSRLLAHSYAPFICGVVLDQIWNLAIFALSLVVVFYILIFKYIRYQIIYAIHTDTAR